MGHLKQLQGPHREFYDDSTPIGGFYGAPGEALTAGTGITTGTGTVHRSWIYQEGPFTKTVIFVDLTGLNSSTAGDIIGKDGGTANCHIGQYDYDVSGTPVRGQISCRETPATGEPDIDVIAADEATGAEDAAYTGLSNDVVLQAAAADYTAGVTKDFTAVPGDGQYLYLAGSGGGDAATYTAGQLVIEIWGLKG